MAQSMGIARFGFWIFTIVCVAPLRSMPQGHVAPKKSANLGRGKLVGRVFSVTKGGDLKPARMADVYIMLYSADGNAVGNYYSDAEAEASEAANKELDAEGKNWTEQQICLQDLHTFRPVIIKVLDWAMTNKKEKQIIVIKTDEEGKFSTTAPEGSYEVSVRGRAGYSESLWEGGVVRPLFAVRANQVTNLKFSAPDKSCIVEP